MIRISDVPVSHTKTRPDSLANASDRRVDPVFVPIVLRKHYVVIRASVSVTDACGADPYTHGFKETKAPSTVLPQRFFGVSVFDESMAVNGTPFTRAVTQGIATEPFRERARQSASDGGKT